MKAFSQFLDFISFRHKTFYGSYLLKEVQPREGFKEQIKMGGGGVNTIPKFFPTNFIFLTIFQMDLPLL